MSEENERIVVDQMEEMLEEARRIVEDARKEARELKHRARDVWRKERHRRRGLHRDRKKEKVLNLRIGKDLEEKSFVGDS